MNKTKFLKEQKILHLATINSNGTPHIIPVWFIFSSGKFFVGTNTRTKKAKNIKKNERVGFCIDKGIKSPISGLMGTGKAKIISNPIVVSKLAKKILFRYFTTLENKSAQELLADTNCIIEINPEKYSTWNY